MDYYKLDKGVDRKMVTDNPSNIEEGQLKDNDDIEQDVVLLQNLGDNLSPENTEEAVGGLDTKSEKEHKKNRKPKVVLPKPTLPRDKEQKALQRIVSMDPLSLTDNDYDRYKTAKARLHGLELNQKRDELCKRELEEMDQQHDTQLWALDHDHMVVDKRRKVTHSSEVLEDTEMLGIRQKILNLDDMIASRVSAKSTCVRSVRWSSWNKGILWSHRRQELKLCRSMVSGRQEHPEELAVVLPTGRIVVGTGHSVQKGHNTERLENCSGTSNRELVQPDILGQRRQRNQIAN